MGILQSVLKRGERNGNDQVVAQPDPTSEASSVDSGSGNDLLENMGLGTDEHGRPYITVNGVPCFTRSQLELELCKRKPVDKDNGLPRSPEDMSIPELEIEVDKCHAGYKRLRALVDKLKETKVGLIQVNREQATLEDLGNVQNKKPVVVRNRSACPYFTSPKTVNGQLISKKIGEQLLRYQKAEHDKHLGDGDCYTFLVTVQPTPASTNCDIELVGHEDGSKKVPRSPRKRSISRA